MYYNICSEKPEPPVAFTYTLHSSIIVCGEIDFRSSL